MEKPIRRFIMGFKKISLKIPITTLSFKTKKNLKGMEMLQTKNHKINVNT